MSCSARGIRGSTSCTNMPGLGAGPTSTTRGGSGGGSGQRSARGSASTCSPPTGPAFRGSVSDVNSVSDAMRKTPGQLRALMASSMAGPGGSRWKFEVENMLGPELRRCEVENDELQRKLAAAEAKAARYAKELAEIRQRVSDVLAGAGMTQVEWRCESPSTAIPNAIPASSSSAAATAPRGERRATAPFEPPSSLASLSLPSAARGCASPLGGMSPRPPPQRLDRLEHPVEEVGPVSPNHTPSHTPRLPFFLPIASPGTPGRASPGTTPGNLTPAAASSFGSRMPNHHLFGANPQPADRRAAAEEELHGSERLAALPPAGHLAASVPLLPIARQSSNRSPELDSELNPELMTDMMDQLTAASAASNSLLSPISAGGLVPTPVEHMRPKPQAKAQQRPGSARRTTTGTTPRRGASS